ncbi:hypothetical protein ACHAXS_010019 [Conticribra weissflogii]
MAAVTGQVLQWWTKSDLNLLLQAEHRLLSALVSHPFHKPAHNRQKNNDHNGINIVEFRAKESAGLQSKPTVILAHGFGSGLGFFYSNIDSLLNSGKISRVVCVDWLGMGGSARPPCWESPVRSIFSGSGHSSGTSPSEFSLCNSIYSPSRAVDFFLDPFDRLLSSHGNNSLFLQGEPLWLVGHSLGGYLAARYAMRINKRTKSANLSGDETETSPNLEKLILASPVGFQPLASKDRIPASNLPTALRLVDALWSANFTPQSIVRILGSSRGKQAAKRALRGRIPHLNSQCSDLLAEYLYHITVAPASGEYAMNSLLEPAATGEGAGVYAREPLGGGVMTEYFVNNNARERGIPLQSVKVLFGDNDWMRFHEPSARREMKLLMDSSGINTSVHLVPGAGHHLYLDNADSFVKHILEE